MEGTVSRRRGRKSAMAPAMCRVSTFCGRMASSATAWTNLVRETWYSSKTPRTALDMVGGGDFLSFFEFFLGGVTMEKGEIWPGQDKNEGKK
jgi:hypothetical protein